MQPGFCYIHVRTCTYTWHTDAHTYQGCIKKMELGGAKRDSLKFRGGKGYHVSMAYGGGVWGIFTKERFEIYNLVKV